MIHPDLAIQDIFAKVDFFLDYNLHCAFNLCRLPITLIYILQIFNDTSPKFVLQKFNLCSKRKGLLSK